MAGGVLLLKLIPVPLSHQKLAVILIVTGL